MVTPGRKTAALQQSSATRVGQQQHPLCSVCLGRLWVHEPRLRSLCETLQRGLNDRRKKCILRSTIHMNVTEMFFVSLTEPPTAVPQVIGSGYGKELATLATRDRSEHVERMNRIETVFALIPHTVNSSASARDPSASGSAENITRIVTQRR